MKKYINFPNCLMLIALGFVTFMSCEKVPIGYISDQIRYVNDTFRIPRGTNYKSNPQAFELDGSNYPISVKLLEVRDLATGKPTDVFNEPHEVYIWNALFNVDTDTTVALLNKKRNKQNVPSLEIVEKSGQLILNEGSLDIPVGKYAFDIQVTNGSGVKTFKNISVIEMLDQPFEDKGTGCAYFIDGTNTSGDIAIPTMTYKKISGDGYQVRLKVVDKNGLAFNPKLGELQKRGDRPLFETYAKFNPVEYTDTTMICNYELTPFPILEAPGYGYLMYYRIPSNKVIIDPGVTPNVPGQTYNVNPRWAFRLLVKGTYEVTVRLPKVTRKP
ncbi:DUF5007 domain-containing protein [Chitinophaga barathri]|uniref:DUF5007 domain-containing protein n=1 Tax=Chitinophaga barathri TaxID=1647451 RepID=A0A3N4MEE7_9BACT|nr:DUF5007 domain-containing protein [Chitinophaga barathri]RPD38089.1 DUF5007 domain-containing protein [Chitinophaga barathri]